MRLDYINQKLLNRLQMEFPLIKKPYAALGLSLGITEEEVIRRIGQLGVKGLIRQISPVFDARSLGYKTTLVAMRIPENQMDKAAQVITEHPGISHGYERDHYFNLWLTLAIPATVDIEAELQRLAGPIKTEAIFTLPALRLFKLRAYFALNGDGQTEATPAHTDVVHQREVKLSPEDRLVINELQQDLPLVSQPFADISARLGMDENKFLAQCQSLLSRGIMRRFSAAINHRSVGFVANAMTCWAAPPEKVVAAGQKLASLREVSHCYERKTNPFWRYNLFAMIHTHTKEEGQEIADKVSCETNLKNYVQLFSTRELKKTRVKYLV